MNQIDICNMALAYIGNTRTISSLAEQTKESILCSRFYNVTRQELLQDFPWNFATKTVDLTVTTDTDDRFEYVYEYPEDCLRVVRVGQEDDGEELNDYSIRTIDDNGDITKRIACDLEDARCQYIFDVQDMDNVPPVFFRALALSLATELSMPMSAAPQITQSVYQQARLAIDKAKRMCALESRIPLKKENRYSSARI